MKRPAFLILLFVWLGVLFGIAFALPPARSEPAPIPFWAAEALHDLYSFLDFVR